MNRIVFENIKDFDTAHIFECGQCFRWVPESEGSSVYIGAAGSYAARISAVQSDDQPDRECLTVVIEATGGDESFWRNYFDLDTDYSEIRQTLEKGEPRISCACEYGKGIRILNQDLFETVISFIISQNNNIPRIRKLIEAVSRTYGNYIGEAFGREWYAFPDADALAAADIDDLRKLRLGYRAEYIKSTAERYIECGRPESREDLLAFHGIGPKVANCIMLFGLHKTSAFPVDTWVRHIMNDMYGFDEGDMKGMESFASERFGRLAGYAQQYLFYYYRDSRK